VPWSRKLQTDRNHYLAPRQSALFAPKWRRMRVPFADDAEIPGNWLCLNGMEGKQTLESKVTCPTEKVSPPRTHWDIAREHARRRAR